MPTDPNPPATQPDTTGVSGATGPLPAGSAATAANSDTTVFGGGAGGGAVANATATVDTAAAPGGTGTVVPSNLAGTTDSVQGGGGLRLDKDQAYRAPSGPVAASSADTTRTDSPVSGMLQVLTRAYVKVSNIATITHTGGTLPVGSTVYLYSVHAELNGTAVVATSGAGTFTFSTDVPAGNITAGAAPVGSYLSVTLVANMTGTLDSYNVGAVPVTNTNVPVAPTGVTATANADGTVTIGWTPPANPVGAPIRGFLIESDRGFSHWAPANATSYTTDLWVLEASVAITFTVAARNDNGLGAKSTASAAATPANVNFTASSPDAATNPVYLPSGNQDFNLVGVQDRAGIDFDWTLPQTNVAYSAVTLKVFNAATGVQEGSDYVLGGSAVSQDVTGLTYGQSYYATVSATNANGTQTSDRSATVAVALLVPAAAAAPTGVDAGGATDATVTYANPADTGGSAITDHVIQWSSNDFATVAGSTTDAASPATVTTGAGTWKFRVAAVNAIGTGAFSAASANVVVS